MTRGGGGLSPFLRESAKTGTGPLSTNSLITNRLERMACRSMRATVGRTIGSVGAGAVREVLEPGVFLDERQLRGPDRTVALLADDDLGGPLVLGVRVALRIPV